MPYREMDMISMDPVDPIGAYTHVEMLGDLTPEAIDTLVEVAGVDSGSPLIILELKDRYDPDNLFRFNRNIPPSSTGG
jgi:hypothetical protein